MIEKKTMGYVDFEYPHYDAAAVTTIVDADTNEVILYRPDETSKDWYTPRKVDHFFPTVEEANQALEKYKQELIAKMPEVKAYLETMSNWSEREKDDENFKFEENDFLPYCYQPNDDSYTRRRNAELEKENDYLLGIIRTGFINIKGDTFKVDDIEHIKWGESKAEILLKEGRRIETGNSIEYHIIKNLFGNNNSQYTYTRLNDKPKEDD